MDKVTQVGRSRRLPAIAVAVALGATFAWLFLPTPADNPPDTAEAEWEQPEDPARQLGEPDTVRNLVEPESDTPEALAETSDEPEAPPARNAVDPGDTPDGETPNAAGEAEPDAPAEPPSTPLPPPPPAQTAAPAPTAPPSQPTPSEPTTQAPAPTTQPPAATTQPPAATTQPAAPPTSPAPATTAAPPTTAAAAPADGGGANPVDAQQFTDWPIRNTNLDNRTQFVNTPASQLNWQQFTEASDRTIGLGSTTPNKHLGQFRTQCSFSHFAYDDPLVFPGQEGASHLHMYFGNTQANADSTYRSLRDSGSSSCNGFEGNRTAYWVPAVFDAGGSARIPSRIEVYYKSHDRSFSIVQKPPEGLGMVAGKAATNPNIQWGCQEAGAQGANLNRPVQQRQNTIPRCSGTATLLAHIMFPQCLGGNVGMNSGDNTSQMQYPTRGYFTNSCPDGTRYISAIEYFLAWAPDNHDGQTDQWWLASDVQDDGTRAPNGSTLHGDWFGAWNPELMDRIHQACVSRLAECGWDLTGNNERLQWVEHFGGRNPAAYSGRRAIPASDLSEALCPGDRFTNAEDAATCGAH